MKGINLDVFRHFLRSEQTSGIILIISLIISLIIANSPLAAAFQNFLDTRIGITSVIPDLDYSVSVWINDGLMAIFFLLVGLEIKREIIEGELSSPKKAAIPVFAALGGMLVPALIYTFCNIGSPTGSGWGIPMATDIAFALGIISLLGKRVPASLKIFLAALAIVDDLGAILVIAIFYTTELHLIYLFYSALLVAILIVLNKTGVKRLIFYIVPGIILWYTVHHSGIHATVAGVLLAFTIPTNPVKELSPLETLEHVLMRPVNFFIMPIFALANTNITFESGMIDGLISPLGLGIIFGLMLGKPIGVTLFSWLSVRLGFAVLPRGAGWNHIVGLGMLAGIGFTMSIFIAILSFADPVYQTEAKFAILVASVASGIAGFFFLSKTGVAKIPENRNTRAGN